MALSDITLPQGGMPASDLLTAGQPSAAQIEALAAAGLKNIINLRPSTEDAGFDEAAMATGLGMNYTVVAVAGPDDINLENAKKLDTALAAAAGTPTLVHCASSNRVGALLALRAAWLQNQTSEQAMALGRAGGLTKMEPLVQKLLENGPG
tara:strand:+ start:28482 stop:28934 length:453 start_codon:yes stop_codon:yes gene_type:complete